MNKRSRASSSSLFLLELIMAILIFSIAAAICVQLFAKSHRLSTQARSVTAASDLCISVAELVRSSASEEELQQLFEEAFPAAGMSEHEITAYVDENLEEAADAGQAAYTLLVFTQEADGMLTADIRVQTAQQTPTDGSGQPASDGDAEAASESVYELTVERCVD